jgi:hypothetical protein
MANSSRPNSQIHNRDHTDLHIYAARQSFNSNGFAGGMVAGKIGAVDFVYLCKKTHIAEKNGRFYDVPESKFGFAENFAEILHYLVRFGLEAAHFKFAGSRYKSNLPADKYEPVCFYRLAVRTDGRRGFLCDNDLF